MRGNERNTLAALRLDLGGHRAHELDEVILDHVPIGGGYQKLLGVGVVWVWRPALFDHVLEMDGGRLSDGTVGGIVGADEAKDR